MKKKMISSRNVFHFGLNVKLVYQVVFLAVAGVSLVVLANAAIESSSFPEDAAFTTLATFSLKTEGLTGDNVGNLYTAGRLAGAGVSCPVWRVNIDSPSPVVVGYIPAPNSTSECSTSGLALNDVGDMFVAAGGQIFSFTPDETSPPTATVYATGVPGANGIAFDKEGNLWVTDGTTNQGRVWKIPSSGGTGAEQFRIQPMQNSLALGGTVALQDGVGRQVRNFPPGNLTNTLGTTNQIVANGIAFDQKGVLYVADSSRGAIWKAELNHDGSLKSLVGCDTTFASDTLCMSNIFVAHPWLENMDGITLDMEGNIWASVNGRNAIVVVTRDGKIAEIFRNPVDATTQLRNTGPLEFPASPYLLGKRFCTSNFDQDPRDNFPTSGGELNGAVGPVRGKISCMDQDLSIPGLPLPVEH